MLGLFICLIPMFSSQIDPHGTSHLGGAKGVGRVLWPLAFMLGFVSMPHSFEILLYITKSQGTVTFLRAVKGLMHL